MGPYSFDDLNRSFSVIRPRSYAARMFAEDHGRFFFFPARIVALLMPCWLISIYSDIFESFSHQKTDLMNLLMLMLKCCWTVMVSVYVVLTGRKMSYWLSAGHADIIRDKSLPCFAEVWSREAGFAAPSAQIGWTNMDKEVNNNNKDGHFRDFSDGLILRWFKFVSYFQTCYIHIYPLGCTQLGHARSFPSYGRLLGRHIISQWWQLDWWSACFCFFWQKWHTTKEHTKKFNNKKHQ